jgi:prevent-host-death family protein
MKQVNLYDAKTMLSTLVEEAAAGEEIVIAKNGKPRAKLVPLGPATDAPRRVPVFGRWDHLGWKLPENFDEPDLEIEALFYGEGKPDGEL